MARGSAIRMPFGGTAGIQSPCQAKANKGGKTATAGSASCE
jgi:hypothetical protein